MRLIEREVLTVLRRHGYKLTPQRRVVIHTIVTTQNHLTPTAIHEKVHQDYPNIGLVTVYRTLEILAKLGLICEVHAGGCCGSYSLKRPLEHHHHLICSECGAVVDFTGCDLSQLEQRLSLETGFEVTDHLLEFIGLCQSCQKEAA
jgi:Fur family ferric uptake transcriptional regulator